MLRKNILKFLSFFYGRLAYSQEGEDIFLSRILFRKKKGFYVDIGAHHPIRFSNTLYFYKKGWRGINIDACPGSMKFFKLLRRRDINLETAIGSPGKNPVYFAFEESALNTFDPAMAHKYVQSGHKKIYEKIIAKVPLKILFTEHLKPNQTIDFMSVDAEGSELEILQSNDWQKFRPEMVVAEYHCKSVEEAMNSNLTEFMRSVNYKLIGKMYYSLFYNNQNNPADH